MDWMNRKSSRFIDSLIMSILPIRSSRQKSLLGHRGAARIEIWGSDQLCLDCRCRSSEPAEGGREICGTSVRLCSTLEGKGAAVREIKATRPGVAAARD